MNRLTENKVILITRRSRLDELVARFNTVSQARFYVEHLGADFSDYQREHEQYSEARAQAESILTKIGRLQVVDRSFLPNFIFGKNDTVVVRKPSQLTMPRRKRCVSCSRNSASSALRDISRKSEAAALTSVSLSQRRRR